MTTPSIRLYLADLEPVDLTPEQYAELDGYQQIFLDHAGTPFLNPNLAQLIASARDLRSDHGENPEYDRALRELIRHFAGWDSDTELVDTLV